MVEDGYVKKDTVDLICSIGELAGLFRDARRLDAFLDQAVRTVAFHMRAAVCSIYLYDEHTRTLVLTANQGLNPEAVGRLKLQLGEGITGQALKELRTIREADGASNPNFRFVPDSGEDRYRAFMAVPITRGLVRVGVLVVQDPQPGYFDDNDAKALRAIAAQLAGVIENAKLLLNANEQRFEEEKRPLPPLIKGHSLSDGQGYGEAVHLDDVEHGLHENEPEDAFGVTRDAFERAVACSEAQLETLQNEMEERLSDVGGLIFSAQRLILKDDAFSGEMARRIDAGLSPASAIRQVARHYAERFGQSPNPRLKEKVQDVLDIAHRMMHNLLIEASESEANYKGHVVLARSLLPSNLMKLAAQHAEAVVLESGASSAHVSVLARSLRLPAVSVGGWDLRCVHEGTPIWVDAGQGNVFIRPDENVLTSMRESADAQREASKHAERMKEASHTADGVRVHLLATVNLVNEVEAAVRFKAEGIGLYRSEFPFIVRNGFPSEEEQYRIYRKLVEGMRGAPVHFRTLDIGGDKLLAYFSSVDEANPFLGLRALRFSLRNREVFVQQVRAFLRAGADARIGIMLPMVASLDDFETARDMVDTCRMELIREGLPEGPKPEIGVMMELPSAVELADELAAAADFLSIGSNDLVQYILAADRTNRQVADWYIPHHPAVLRSLRRLVIAARKAGKPIAICGDLARDPKMIPCLLGMGLRRFTVGPPYLLKTQEIVRKTDVKEAEAYAERLLRCARINEVESLLEAWAAENEP